MKILALCEKKEDGLLLEHHLKSAIKEIGLINIEVASSLEIPTDESTANVYVMSRDIASNCKLPNIVIVDDVLNYNDIKEKMIRLFTVYGVL
jgi:galactitol-specific phosphotransferase system IIB component